MGIDYNQQAYTIGTGQTTTNYPHIDRRDPTNLDVMYFSVGVGKIWINNADHVNPRYWYAESYNTIGGYLKANWVLLGSSASGPIVRLNVDSNTPPGTDPVLPDGTGTITITGNQVIAGSIGANVIKTDSLAANTFTIEIQRSQAVASPGSLAFNGVSHFDAAHFTVGANGFVGLLGGGQAIDSIQVDAFTAPGTNPVLPTIGGLITVTGGQVAAGVVGTNVIRTDSLSANTYTIEIQRSAAVGASAAANNGVSHFNSAQFTVDGNGFVSSITGSNNVVRQVFSTAGTFTYTPTAGMKQCDIAIQAGGGAGGGATATAAGEYSVGGGGGGGEYATGIFTAVQIGASQTVIVGAGGTGNAGAAGNAGGNSSVGALISAIGGSGGGTAASGVIVSDGGGQGGLGGAGGDFRSQGSNGGYAIGVFSASVIFSGIGGNSVYGSGGRGVLETSGNGSNGANEGFGGGAGGGANTASQAATTIGGVGSKGLVVITEYL